MENNRDIDNVFNAFLNAIDMPFFLGLGLLRKQKAFPNSEMSKETTIHQNFSRHRKDNKKELFFLML
jgi:hypothetical protein